jgi:hypothetical protein
MNLRDDEQLLITVSLIPRPNWGKDLAKLLPKRTWEQLRKQVYAEAEHRCVICGAAGSLHADEVWDYDEEHVIQRLISIRAVCPDCHACKHWGRTQMVSPPAELERLAAHFCRVNNCDPKVFKAHRTKAANEWRRRSALTGWQIDFGEWAPLVQNAPVSVWESRKASLSSTWDDGAVLTDDLQIPLRVLGTAGEDEARQFFARYHPDEWFEHLDEWNRLCGKGVGYALIHLLFSADELRRMSGK